MTDLVSIARAVHFIAAITVFGALLFLRAVVAPIFAGARSDGALDQAAATLRHRLRLFAWLGLLLAVASGAAWLMLTTAAITGTSLADILSGNAVWTVLTDTNFGHVQSIRAVIAACLAVWLLRLEPRRPGLRVDSAVAALLAGCFLGSLAWAGHSGGGIGLSGDIRLIADGAHLLAAGGWVGGLAPLGLLLAMTRGRSARIPLALAAEATARYSIVGIVTVATLLATGLFNTWFLVGGVPQLVGTGYGRLLLAKLALFAIMVGVAAYNRMRLLPRLGVAGARADQTLDRLRQDSFVEAALGLLVVSIVGVLGTIPPAAHSEVQWPFSLRLDLATLHDPAIRASFVGAMAAMALGVLLVVCSLWIRRWRWPLLAAGVALVAWFFPSLGLLAVEAFPTSFYQSPTGYTAASIAQGKRLFAAHCAACHGPDGEGGGPAAKSLKIPPADLTSEHVGDHRDGDLFWFITAGTGDGMPGFADTIDTQGRWSLIDFIRANFAAPRLQESVGEATNAAYRAPDFSAQCADGSTVSIRDLRGRIVHVVLAGPRSAERLRRLSTGTPDIATIAIALDDEPVKDVSACVVHDADVVATFALHAGRDDADVDGIELLIDAAGQLRSIWYPKQRRPNWSDPDAFSRIVDQMKRTPSSSEPSAPHLHSH